MSDVTRVLVIDDDRSLRRGLSLALKAQGFEVEVAANGNEGISHAALFQPDVVVLDMSLPDLDGVAVCRRIREFSDVPILVLSALDEERRKVAALQQGADDYVTKPFSMAELLARLEALHRRHRPVVAEGPTTITVGPLTIDLVHHMAQLDNVDLTLTAKEFDLLAFLARHRGKVCTQGMLLHEVWGAAYGTEANYLRVYAHRLRRKLGAHEAMLVTHAGIGYELVDEGA